MVTKPGSGELGLTERRQRIVDLVRTQRFVQVRQLTSLLGVSEVTIRHDLRSLEEQGEVQRVRGGATTTGEPGRGHGAEDWSSPAVGALAAALVRSGDTVVLDSGRGVRAVAEALVNRRTLSDVVVHAESLHVVAPFAGHHDRFTVVVPAGTLDHAMRIVPDRDVEIEADLAVLGCAGLSVEGVLAETETEASARRRAAFAARRGVVVVPTGAFDVPGDYVACSLDHVDACISGERLESGIAGSLRAAGLRILVAS